MVVAVLADIVEIIVFATCTDALLELAEAPKLDKSKSVIHLLCVYRTLQLG
jgi:hypothetical protein